MQLNQPPQKYITDVPYSFKYFKELTPVNLNYVAALNSIEPPPIKKEFTYCDLGCGNGLTTNILAADYPQGKFYGIDLNPEHINNAKSIAKQGNLNNIQFICNTFSKLNLKLIPKCDYIVLHGVISYLGEKIRNDVFKIIREKLKPNGLVYISYNAMPGWTTSMPLREIVKQYADRISGTSLEKVQKGMSYLKLLQEENIPLFSENTIAKRYIDTIQKGSLNYLAHEYLQEYCDAFYFREMNQFFETMDMNFVGSMPFYLNHKPFAIPQTFIKYYGSVKNREFLEMQKDFIANSFFRRDVYAHKEKHVLTKEERDEYFRNCYFARIIHYEKPAKKITINKQNFTLTGNVYKNLQKIFQEGIYNIEELCKHPLLKATEEAAIATAVRNLVAFGLIFPCQTEGIKKPLPKTINNINITHPINTNLMQRIDKESDEVALASQILGSAVKINHITATILETYAQTKKDKKEIIKTVTERIISEMPTPPVNQEFFQNRIKAEVEHFLKNILPILFRLGILEVH